MPPSLRTCPSLRLWDCVGNCLASCRIRLSATMEFLVLLLPDVVMLNAIARSPSPDPPPSLARDVLQRRRRLTCLLDCSSYARNTFILLSSQRNPSTSHPSTHGAVPTEYTPSIRQPSSARPRFVVKFLLLRLISRPHRYLTTRWSADIITLPGKPMQRGGRTW